MQQGCRTDRPRSVDNAQAIRQRPSWLRRPDACDEFAPLFHVQSARRVQGYVNVWRWQAATSQTALPALSPRLDYAPGVLRSRGVWDRTGPRRPYPEIQENC